MRVLVTGASGWCGSALVPELIEAGHEVVGLARSDASAAALDAAGVRVVRGDLDDLGTLRREAEAADGVIHLAFKHDIAFSGDYQGAADADRVAVETFGEALAGSGRPFVIASGVGGIAPGRVATEADWPVEQGNGGVHGRIATARVALGYASRGVRSSVVRLPIVHGEGDPGFLAVLIGIAREKGVSGYIGDGTQRWPFVHRDDAASLFRLAVEKAPAGSVLHAIADEGVALREVAEVIGRHLGVPVVAVRPEDAAGHFGWLAGFLGTDGAASSAVTREMLGWRPTQIGFIDDLEKGHYFASGGADDEAAAGGGGQ
ncbi:SDR family oxidoreductase [Sphaerisporangium rubeum]|uniref:Nucleoside-diphosphate-sugar epimerase n=1 Tax=Sphaerisporangium rubeum TaxID=321317 RepID=A0A7X0M632_9ACTN|nr:SDR family oxidoreductase [Sphaerisporangium rubeum]MBB6471574.1 nucleoside-diphosphate-sugar epimerase [Sphaerisporangium rubeum]